MKKVLEVPRYRMPEDKVGPHLFPHCADYQVAGYVGRNHHDLVAIYVKPKVHEIVYMDESCRKRVALPHLYFISVFVSGHLAHMSAVISRRRLRSLLDRVQYFTFANVDFRSSIVCMTRPFQKKKTGLEEEARSSVLHFLGTPFTDDYVEAHFTPSVVREEIRKVRAKAPLHIDVPTAYWEAWENVTKKKGVRGIVNSQWSGMITTFKDHLRYLVNSAGGSM